MASYPTVPDYMTLAAQQAAYNSQLARNQSQLNNPNQYNPFGSKTTTYNPDGSSSVNTALNPTQQALFDGSNNIAQGVQGYANGMIGGLNYNNVAAMPSASQSDLNTTRDAVYGQQTQYLDPQFQQGQSDLDSSLANKGIMEGSDAYTRAQNNFALQKQAAYGDARDRAIQAGGAEQSRLFNLGMSARQQGINEDNALYAGNLNGLNAIKGAGSYTMPTFQGTTATNIGNVDFLNAANQAYQGQLGQANAQNASNANLYNGLFSLGSAALQNPDAVKGVWNWATSAGS